MNFKPQCTTKADLLIMAGESIKMQDAAWLEPRCKVASVEMNIAGRTFDQDQEHYEFPVGICEGKRVWLGDELYGKVSGLLYKVGDRGAATVDFFGRYSFPVSRDCSGELTWTPPKPKTIDILGVYLEDAMVLRSYLCSPHMLNPDYQRIHKALEAAIKKAEA